MTDAAEQQTSRIHHAATELYDALKGLVAAYEAHAFSRSVAATVPRLPKNHPYLLASAVLAKVEGR